MILPQLPSEPLRREDRPDYNKQIWQPNWNCFCCLDTGIVNAHLAKKVVPSYQFWRDKLPICNLPSCDASGSFSHIAEENFDMRFSAQICMELDRLNREDWRRSTVVKADAIQAANSLSKKMGIAPRDRNGNDQHELAIKKSELEAKSPGMTLVCWR
jgi:hypothetical protein